MVSDQPVTLLLNIDKKQDYFQTLDIQMGLFVSVFIFPL